MFPRTLLSKTLHSRSEHLSRSVNIRFQQSVYRCYYSQNYFEIFNITPKFIINKNELKQKYWNLQKMYHPDVESQPSNTSVNINNAYEIIKNDTKRLEHLIQLYSGIDLEKIHLDQQFLIDHYELIESSDSDIIRKITEMHQQTHNVLESLFSDKLPESVDWKTVCVNYKKFAFLSNFLKHHESFSCV